MTPLLWVCAAWLAGVAGGLLLAFPPEYPLVAACAGLVLGGLLWKRRRVRTVAFLLALVCLAGWRAEAHQDALDQDQFAGMRGPVVLRGVIVQEPERSDSSLRWRFRVSGQQSAQGEWAPVQAEVLVWSRHVPALQYGDIVELAGTLEAAPAFDRFDYAAYLARQGIHSVVRYPRVTVIGNGQGEPQVSAALALRRALSASLDRQLPEPQNALAQGILLGVRSGLPPDILDDFRSTGTTHILAISGHNMAVVAGLLSLVFGWRFSRRSWVFVVIASLLLAGYSLMVGLPPSVSRAATMAILAYVAGAFGRETYPIGGLMLAAAGLAAVNPSLLLDAGFQLSFGAMWGLLAFGPHLRHWLAARAAGARGSGWRAKAVDAATEGAAATLAAALVTLPIQAFTFGQMTLLGLPTTLFALPFMALLLPAAGVAALLGALPAPLSLLALPAAAVTWGLASGMIAVVQFWAQMPLASVPVPAGEPAWLALYLPVAFGAWWLLQRRGEAQAAGQPAVVRGGDQRSSFKQRFLRGSLAGLLVAAAGAWWVALASPGAVTVHFFDTPGGESTLIESPSGQRILVDGGASGPALSRLLSGALPPWERTLDLVVLTNPKPQHVAGLLTALERFEVRAVAESGLLGDSPEYEQWQRLVAERGIQRTELRAGMRITMAEVEIDVLHPTEPWLSNVRTGVDRSDTSVVLELRAHGQRVLLASDVRARSVLAMRDRGLLTPAAVLKLPASSGTASLSLLRESVQPVAVVVSGSEVELSRLSATLMGQGEDVQLLRTDLDGSVRLTLTKEHAVLRGDRPRP